MIMDIKSNNLIKSLGQVYQNPNVKQDADLSKLLEECVRPLMNNNDDKVYFEVIDKLSNGISKYYSSRRQTAPQEFMDLYDQVKKDVPKKSADGKRLRREFEATGLVAIGI